MHSRTRTQEYDQEEGLYTKINYCTAMGPSIYDVHTEGEGGQAQVDACGRGEGQAPCGRPQRKLKLESTDVILSSSHAKRSVSASE